MKNVISQFIYTVFGTKKRIIVVEHTDFEDLQKHKKEINSMPTIIMSMTDFSEGRDVFPVEFLNMQHDYSVEQGEDVLKTIKIKKEDLRHQLEFELRSKRIHLKEQCLHGTPKSFVQNIIPTLGPIIQALLHYKEEALENDITAALSKIENAYSIDVASLHEIAKNGAKMSKEGYNETLEELDKLLKQFINTIN